jgi:hypothetical protein
MQIVYHLGVHCTDDERLVKTLLRNRGRLAEDGIAVPGPTRYRTLIRETAASLEGRSASPETQTLILDQILDGESQPRRLILSWDSFLAFPPWAVKGRFYAAAGPRSRSLAMIFPDHDCEFHLAIRNPASFLPALLAKQRGRSYEDLMGDLDPQDLFWSETITEIVRQNPASKVHVWCDEDTPLIWPEILKTVSDHPDDLSLDGRDELLSSLLTPEGITGLARHFKDHPPASRADHNGIIARFLNTHGRSEEMEISVDLPGWTEDLIEVMTLQYDQDLARIADLPGVMLTLP